MAWMLEGSDLSLGTLRTILSLSLWVVVKRPVLMMLVGDGWMMLS